MKINKLFFLLLLLTLFSLSSPKINALGAYNDETDYSETLEPLKIDLNYTFCPEDVAEDEPMGINESLSFKTGFN